MAEKWQLQGVKNVPVSGGGFGPVRILDIFTSRISVIF